MFKGLAALFSSGAILNPMVWGGILLGLFLSFDATSEETYALYKNYNFYLLVLLIAGLYNVLFKKIYTDRGDFNFVAVALNSIFSAIKFVVVSLLTLSFIMLISF